MATLACFVTMDAQVIEDFVNRQLELYPHARLLDIYKSCFQDCMGAEHLVNDTTSARAYLEQELATTNPNELMSWYSEPCGIEGNYVRVSLKAVYDGLITADMLLSAFIASANAKRPSIEMWVERWQHIIVAIDDMNLDLPHYQEDKQFINDVLSKSKYAISHSPDYRNNYSPHYRIVSRDIFERDILPLLPQP